MYDETSGTEMYEAGAEVPEGTADMDGSTTDAFLGGLLDDAELEDQQDGAGQPPEEDEPQGDEDQIAAQQSEGAPETAEPEAGRPADEAGAAVQTVHLQFMDSGYDLPAEAVTAISQALGQDAVTLMQKGLNYENKGAREARLLTSLAEAAGRDLPTFLQEAEQNVQELYRQRARDAVRAELPEGTPDEAIERLAEQRLRETRNRREMEQYRQRQAARQAAQREAAARKEAAIAPWRRFVTTFGITETSQIPNEVQEMARQGMDPCAAMYKYQLDQQKAENQTLKKNNANRAQTPGSMQGAGADTADAFLAGLLGDD